MSRAARLGAGTLSDLVRAVAPQLSAELVGADQLARMERISAMFPARLSECIGFECRLSRSNAPVDFMFCVDRSAAELCDTLLPRPVTHPVWGRLRDFFRAWPDACSTLRSVREVWLEFDLGSAADDLPVPSIFFQIAAGFARRETVRALLNQVQVLLGDNASIHSADAGLAACLERLPPTTTAVIFGVLLPRQVNYLRLCVQGLDGDQVLSYLGSVGWAGDRLELQAILDTLAPTVDLLTLDLDVAGAVQPRVGIEYMFKHRSRPANVADWQQVLVALQHVGLCRPGLPEALLRFCTSSVPEHGRGGVQDQSRRVWRRLNHIKVVHSPKADPEAKCYLFARYVEGGQTRVPIETG